ncbi:MAG: hypothetical protein JNK64_25030 [Myxococcales bacterium]|nr:hypothetical protein [Myxococcales bacterium]
MRGTLAMVGAVTLGACTDPSVDVTLVFPPKGLGAVTALADDLQRIDLTVAVLTAKPCAAIIDGTVTADELALGRRTTARLDRGDDGFTPVALTDVPRLDPKVFVLTGYDASGAVIAGGCEDVLAIEGDVVVEVQVEPALITRVVPGPLTSPSLRLPLTPAEEALGAVQVIARERRAGGDLVPVGSLRTTLRGIGGEVTYGAVSPPTTPADQASGLFTITGLDQPVSAVGPIELVVRGAWSDQVNRISAAVPPLKLQTIMIGPADVPNTIAPSWAVMETRDAANQPAVVAAALFKGAAGTTQLVVIREGADDTLVRQPPVPAPEVRALATFRRDLDATLRPSIVARVSTGWVQLAWQTDPPTAMRLTTETTTAADQLLAIPPCGAASIGLLVGTGAVFTGYEDLVATAAAATSPIAKLAADLTSLAAGGATLEPLGAVCMVTSVGVATPVVAVRQTLAGRAQIYLTTPDVAPIATDFVGAVSAMPLDVGAALVAGVRTATGVRVQSYRLKYQDGAAPRLVPDGVIDHALPDVPRALAAMLANRDPYVDTLAIETLPGALGLSMTLGARVAGDELSAMTIVDVVGTDQSLRPIRLVDTAAGGGKQELLVTGSNGLATYDLTRPRPQP